MDVIVTNRNIICNLKNTYKILKYSSKYFDPFVCGKWNRKNPRKIKLGTQNPFEI